VSAIELALPAAAAADTPPAPEGRDPEVVLKPLSRPELGDIRVDGVLAVGRAEQPFAGYRHEILAMLSRRHARIFCEAGEVYVADLESSNGTTVNQAAVAQSPKPVRDGDEVCFGGVLSYRVEITPRTNASPAAFTLTLTPASEASGLETLVITRFPFLVSKTEGPLSRLPGPHAAQLGYLSRRHAHVFLKGGNPWVEDLGSTNGTFVDGLRLQERAVPLQDGALLALGGDHFSYRVGITQAASPEPATRPEPARTAAPRGVESRSAADKTTFVAAATSFLDIFCPDTGAEESAEGQASAAPSGARQAPAQRRPRGRAMALWAEIASVFGHQEEAGARSGAWKAVAVLGMLALGAGALHGLGAADRDLKELIAAGKHAEAALLANRFLEKRPEDVELKARATEAALKAEVPDWLARMAARDYDAAAAVLARLSQLGLRNSELAALVAELDWLGQLERLVSERGGPDQPIRIYADEDRIAALIDRWNGDTREHQRGLARIASHVPEFGARYAEALTHVRRLQSQATVHLGVIGRLKGTIVAELKRDRPEALEPVLEEIGAKYPDLGGLDGVRQDLERYLELRSEARSGKPARLFALMAKARFTTPPFQERFRAVAASRQLPPADLVRRYESVTQAWIAGDADASLASLRQMATGSWAGSLLRELERRQGVLSRFAALQQVRGTSGYPEQLLAFRLVLDPEEDVHFVRATQADLDQQKDTVLARAQDAAGHARALWQAYRQQGGIEAAQRGETAISGSFREQAGRLAEASASAQRAMRMYAQLGAAAPEESAALDGDIQAEAQQQRSALRELRNVLEPDLLQRKLALLGDSSDDARKSS
jgi:pSer/pThr/pTyr-binding forkhead associated (FHA) protein